VELKRQAAEILEDWKNSADIIQHQIDQGSSIWLHSFVSGIGKKVSHFKKTIDGVETTKRVRKTTWPRNKEEARDSCHTMGYRRHSKKLKTKE